MRTGTRQLDAQGTGAEAGEGVDGGDGGSGGTSGDGRGGRGAGAESHENTTDGMAGRSAGGSTGAAGKGNPAAGAGGSAGTGGPAGTDPGSSVVDTHRDERQRLASQFCAQLEKYPCLHYSGFTLADPPSDAPVEERVAACEKDTDLTAYALVGEACRSEWVAAATCRATKIAHTCPCNGNDCELETTFAGTLDHPCDSEAAALNNCIGKRPGGSVKGTRAECGWQADAPGSCFVECSAPDFEYVSSRCSGPPGGPFRCPCLLNGRLLVDDATEDERWFVADSCEAAGKQLANGQCFDGINCCFTWTGSDGKGGTMDYCSCTSDPTQSRPDGSPGFPSCEAAAAAGHGKVVDVCPKYAPNWSAYPKP